jgi:pimeloyl-ACP methyl ester carboxylesterase
MSMFHYHGKSLHYTIENNAFPEDILLIHGNLASARWWEPTIERLRANKDISMHGRVVAVDWLGCGQSSAPATKDDLKMECLAADHIALAKALGLSNIQVVGHSTGGLIALHALLAEPDLFDKVLLLDSVSAEGVQLAPEIAGAFEQMSKDRAFCETVMSGTVHGSDPKSPFLQKLFDDAFGVNAMIWSTIPQHLTKIDIRKDIKKIQQPALVLHGEFDQILPEAGSRELAKLMPNAEFELLKGRGHSCNVEDPALFVNKMREFFLN